MRIHILLPLSMIFVLVFAGPIEDAKHLVFCLKLAITNNHIRHVKYFITQDFVFDNCGKSANYNDFVERLQQAATPPISMSLDFEATSATIENGILNFVIHFPNSEVDTYDVEYSAKRFKKVGAWMIFSGKTLGCPTKMRKFMIDDKTDVLDNPKLRNLTMDDYYRYETYEAPKERMEYNKMRHAYSY